MNAEHLLQHFERISEAPDAILRLRRFILDLAVRGKLVEHDPNDEPATELLKRIQAEKARLMKDGKLRKQKHLRAVGKDEVPSISPSNWKWERLGTLSTMITKGSTPTSYGHAFTKTGISFIKVESIKKGLLLSKNVTSFISEETHNFLARSQLETGDILFSIAGSIGTCAVVTNDVLPANTNQALAIIRGTQLVYNPAFLLICIQSSVVHVILNKARGGAMNNVSLDDIQNFVTPLPPLAEQHRIVAKVEELMALCDQLEAAKTEREQSRDRLVAANLYNLNQPVDDEEAFREHARFTFTHLKRTTTRPAHIKQFRQTILNLAVRGKLVAQNPNDEPAAELLKRIQAEKAQLVNEGKIKKDKPLPQISEVEKLFVLPSGWEWVRMQAAFDVRDGTHDTPKYVEDDGIPLITSRNFVDGKISFEDAKLISQSDHNSIKKRSGVDRGDILYSMIGGNIGNQVFVDTDREFSIKNVALFKYYTKKEPLPEYLNLFLKTITIGLQNKAVGGAQPFVSLSLLRNIPFPIPPLAEQRCIVAKVDELMALCDQLEAQLTITEAESRRLLEAVLHEALAPILEEVA